MYFCIDCKHLNEEGECPFNAIELNSNGNCPEHTDRKKEELDEVS